ncbi:hypothetical protein A9Z48_15280 [Pseudomonas aeruginosa]|nr:hypothetical protein A9Z48_15280 [Pseudomonas aeruginosa]
MFLASLSFFFPGFASSLFFMEALYSLIDQSGNLFLSYQSEAAFDFSNVRFEGSFVLCTIRLDEVGSGMACAGYNVSSLNVTLAHLIHHQRDKSVNAVRANRDSSGAERSGNICSGLLIPDTDLGENPRRERGV